MSSDFLPSADAKFDAWYKNFCQYVTEKTSGTNPEWKHIPKERISALVKAREKWETAYEKYLKPHTDEVTGEKNEARKEAEGVIRPFKRNFIDDRDEVSDTQRLAMRVPLRNKTPVRGYEPDTYPEVEVDTSLIRQLLFYFRNLGSQRRGKPRGVHGMQLCWAILDAPPVSMDELANSAFSTSSPLTLKFEENQRGKRVYFCARWETNANKKGPWGVIGSAIIP